MTPRKKAPLKRGRKAKPAEDKLEQLTVRLTPQLKFGLELLARAQHRSLSDTMQWAITVGLNSYKVGTDWTPLGKLASEAWATPAESDRVLRIFYVSPALLTFEDQAACELVDASYERTDQLEEEADRRSGLAIWRASADKDLDAPRGTLPQEIIEARRIAEQELTDLFYEFVRIVWPLIKQQAIKIVNEGGSLQHLSLINILDFSVLRQVRADGAWLAMQKVIDFWKEHQGNLQAVGHQNDDK